MLRVIYTSVQRAGLLRDHLEKLCQHAAAKNSSLDVTGLLLSNGLEFMQCIEGPDEAVIQVYKKIVQDPRHDDIRLLVSVQTQERLFPNWGMVGMVTKPQAVVGNDSVAYALLDHRLYRPWRSLGESAVDLIYEYARVKVELERAGELALLGQLFDVFD